MGKSNEIMMLRVIWTRWGWRALEGEIQALLDGGWSNPEITFYTRLLRTLVMVRFFKKPEVV